MSHKRDGIDETNKDKEDPKAKAQTIRVMKLIRILIVQIRVNKKV